MSDDLSSLIDFSGKARLFPLPNLVLFPHVMQPLHVFEPRYRQMTDDALAGDRLMGLILLKPGWEPNYEGKPDVYPVGCLGKIVAEQRLEDGRYNVLLRGLSRMRVLRELDQGKLYRSAEVELLEDCDSPDAESDADLRQRLTTLVTEWLPAKGAALEQFRKLLQSDLALGILCDIFTFALPLDVELKQEFLEDPRVERRVRRLLDRLCGDKPPAAKGDGGKLKFPPEFSAN
jgi:Lon protease-like protein